MPNFLDYEGLKYYDEKIKSSIGIKYPIEGSKWSAVYLSPVHKYTIEPSVLIDKYIEDVYMFDSSLNSYVKVICRIDKLIDGTVNIVSDVTFDGFVLIKNNY